MNHTRFPKEDHLPDSARGDNQVKKSYRVDYIKVEYSDAIEARPSPYLLWQKVLVQNDSLFTKAVMVHLEARSLHLHTSCSVGCMHNTKVIALFFTG